MIINSIEKSQVINIGIEFSLRGIPSIVTIKFIN